MALGGAWVTGSAALLPPDVVHLSGRTFGALADAAIIGLSGDVGADVQLPATFPGTAGDGQGVPTAAQLFDKVEATVTMATDPSSASSAAVFQVTKTNAAPFRVTLTLRGQANPTAPAGPDVYVKFFSR